MARESGFPYQEFTQWLADAVLAMAVIGKVRTVAESGVSDTAVTAEERTLIEAIGQHFSGRYQIFQKMVASSHASLYPILSPDEVQVIWNVLTLYIVTDERYGVLRSSLTTFMTTHSSVEELLFCVLSCLGPALAPKELWGCALP